MSNRNGAYQSKEALEAMAAEKACKVTCPGSGETVRNVEDGRAECPKCKRSLRARFATGGYEGYGHYFYLPRHNEGPKWITQAMNQPSTDQLLEWQLAEIARRAELDRIGAREVVRAREDRERAASRAATRAGACDEIPAEPSAGEAK